MITEQSTEERDVLGPDVGMQDKAKFVAGWSDVNLRRDGKCESFLGLGSFCKF